MVAPLKTNIKIKPKKKRKPYIKPRIRTLVPPPDWNLLMKAETEEQMLHAFEECETFVHYEVTEKEYLHSMKKWVRDFSGWELDRATITALPDVYLLGVAKHGWKAIRLQFMPKKTNEQLKKILMPLYNKADQLKERMNYEQPIHPSIQNLDEDHKLHPNKMKQWIAAWKEHKDDISRQYVKHMQLYLRTGVWIDDMYGLNRDRVRTPINVALAYDDEGMVKRTKGVYYPDLGLVWKG